MMMTSFGIRGLLVVEREKMFSSFYEIFRGNFIFTLTLDSLCELFDDGIINTKSYRHFMYTYSKHERSNDRCKKTFVS